MDGRRGIEKEDVKGWDKQRKRKAGREGGRGGERRTVGVEREGAWQRGVGGGKEERNYRREGRGIKKHGDSKWNRNWQRDSRREWGRDIDRKEVQTGRREKKRKNCLKGKWHIRPREKKRGNIIQNKMHDRDRAGVKIPRKKKYLKKMWWILNHPS